MSSQNILSAVKEQHATHAVHPPGFASGLWATEVAFGGDLRMLELRRHLDAVCYHVNGDSSSHLLLFGWVKFIKPSPLTHILTYKNPLFLQLLFSFFFPSLDLLDVAEPGQIMDCERKNMLLKQKHL